MLNEQNGHAKLAAHEGDVVHELLRFVGIHASRGLIQQKQLGIRRHCTGDLQLSLLTVRKICGKIILILVKLKNLQEL